MKRDKLIKYVFLDLTMQFAKQYNAIHVLCSQTKYMKWLNTTASYMYYYDYKREKFLYLHDLLFHTLQSGIKIVV